MEESCIIVVDADAILLTVKLSSMFPISSVVNRMIKREIEQWAAVVSGETPKGRRYINVLGVYDTKREANNAASRIRQDPDYKHFTKHYKVMVHVRPVMQSS